MQAALTSSSSVQAAGPTRAAQQAGRRPAGRASAFSQRAGARRRAVWRVSAADSDLTQEDLEEQLEAFMRRQAEIESGAAARKVEPGKVLGADEVSDEDAKRMCRDVVAVLKRLKEQRDMSLNEVRLTVAIEDPRARERRLMGMEDSSGVSRDEMATALMEVSEGKVPTDRIALRELARELTAWPLLDEPIRPRRGPSVAAGAASGGGGELTPAAEDAAAPWRQEGELRPPMGRDPSEAPKGVADQLPDWVGYGALYLVSIAPVLIALGAITVLFLNSLR